MRGEQLNMIITPRIIRIITCNVMINVITGR